jgi:hypothetical protein
MTVANFQSPLLNLAQSIVDRADLIYKRCIIAIEGKHTCNKGKAYEMDRHFIGRLGDNLNAEIANGREIGMFADLNGAAHVKSAETKFGTLDGFVECRPVTEADLPNPHAQQMLGKMALFGTAKIFSHLDRVRSGAIKALSPGIDMNRELIFEVSAVPVASMPGVALFSFNDVLAEHAKFVESRDKAIYGVDRFIECLRDFDRADSEATSAITAKQESFSQFIEYLAELFAIPAAAGGVEYATNPYDRDPVKSSAFNMAPNVRTEPAALQEPPPDPVDDPPPQHTGGLSRRIASATSQTRKRSSGADFNLLLQGTS